MPRSRIHAYFSSLSFNNKLDPDTMRRRHRWNLWRLGCPVRRRNVSRPEAGRCSVEWHLPCRSHGVSAFPTGLSVTNNVSRQYSFPTDFLTNNVGDVVSWRYLSMTASVVLGVRVDGGFRHRGPLVVVLKGGEPTLLK